VVAVAATRINGCGLLRGVILDRQPLWRITFASMLERFGFADVGVCETVDEFDELVETMQPHLAVVDGDGIPDVADHVRTAVERLSQLVMIVASSGHVEPELCDLPHVRKCEELPNIAAALERVITERIDWARLTSRELEILRLVAQGASNRQVGARLWLSDQTIKFHLAHVYRKLGVSSRRDAVERLREAGLLSDVAGFDDGAERAMAEA
jgi:DNA-binding NarL/FixJ family response regulator